MREIIAFYAAADNGKTSTLQKVISHFKPDLKMNGDQRIVIEIQNKKVAITTFGDNAEEIEQNFKFAEQNYCEIWLTASRTKGCSVDMLYKIAKDHLLEIDWVKKAVLSNKLNNKEFDELHSLEAKYLVNYLYQNVNLLVKEKK